MWAVLLGRWCDSQGRERIARLRRGFGFSGLTCYFGADAAEAFGDDDATFAAVPRDGETILAVTIRDKGIDLFEVAYVPGDGSGNWHMISDSVEPSYTVEEGQITAEGEFDLIIDSAESGTTEFGNPGGNLWVKAQCG